MSDRPWVVQLLGDRVKLFDAAGKLCYKQGYAGGAVQMAFVAESETDFTLVLGALPAGGGNRDERLSLGRKELRLAAKDRPQRDNLLIALCAFACPGWLEDALDGSPPPVALLMADAARTE
eukprot:894337-Prymnesium_polylepis.1